MQRYRIKYTRSSSKWFSARLEPDKDGEFCKYADVEKEFERIAALFATEQDDNHNPKGDDQ